jgi:predicted nucleotidyltransferase
MSSVDHQTDLEHTLTALAGELRDLYGDFYRCLYLYGSYARGEADEGSDVDLLLVLGGEVHPTTEIRRSSAVVSGLALESGYLLAVLPVSEEEYWVSTKSFLAKARRDSVPVAAAVSS